MVIGILGALVIGMGLRTAPTETIGLVLGQCGIFINAEAMTLPAFGHGVVCGIALVTYLVPPVIIGLHVLLHRFESGIC